MPIPSARDYYIINIIYINNVYINYNNVACNYSIDIGIGIGGHVHTQHYHDHEVS